MTWVAESIKTFRFSRLCKGSAEKHQLTGKSKGSRLWMKMFHYFQYNQEEFMEHYHKRSNVETTISAIKSKMGETVLIQEMSKLREN